MALPRNYKLGAQTGRVHLSKASLPRFTVADTALDRMKRLENDYLEVAQQRDRLLSENAVLHRRIAALEDAYRRMTARGLVH